MSSVIIYFMTGLQNDAGKFFIFFADLLLSLVRVCAMKSSMPATRRAVHTNELANV